MFSTARRHGFPSSSASKQQDQQHQQKNKKGKPSQQATALSAPPTPSNSNAYAQTPAQAYAAAAAARPATAAAAVGSFACRPIAHASTSSSVSALGAAARPMTASGALPHSVPQAFPTPVPSPSLTPSPLSAPLRLAMPRASATSACATPSPLSSGLPSPTLPPLPASHFSHSSSGQPHGIGSPLSGQAPGAAGAATAAHVLRSPVINIAHSNTTTGSPLVHHARKLSLTSSVVGNGKDELVFDYRVRPSPHIRKFSVSSVAESINSGTPVKSPRSPKSPNSMSESSSPTSQGSSSGRSSMMREDVFSPGDRVGSGLTLQGEVLHTVFSNWESCVSVRRDKEEPAAELEVVRRLGAGSYAIVYLVREVLHHPPAGDLDGLDHDDAERATVNGHGKRLSEELEYWDVPSELDLDSDPLELDGMRRKKDIIDGETTNKKVYYGKEYAVKVLSKAGMDEEALEAQLVEANIHQSLPIHSNIVTLHRALETPSFLLLVLEFVPGQDLYYFLEQARDHYEPEPTSSSSGSTSSDLDSEGEEKDKERRHKANTSVLSVNSVNTVATMNTTRTPPTPSLLSTLNEKQLLGRRRLRLIASMFAQMCEAVAVCHDVGVYHRDIKPENFIVTDGWETTDDGSERRVVVVKLTDFGLSTRDAASSDMDCGSAPYMSYECRNNCAPTYAPRAADVWSLGIVLINMLYHINPWTDTTQGVCPSFSSFLASPEHFFMQRFAGMVPSVASFLCQRVFCILPSDDPADSAGRRVSAREFGRWARQLPVLMAREEPVGVPLALADAAVMFPTTSTSSPKESAKESEKEVAPVTSLSPTLPLSPISPTSPSSTLLAQSLAAVLAQQEAASAAGSSSPAWRHKRGLSNASVGYALSSVPQSRRPASRGQSFSAERSHLGISGLGSATASRAATPLLRGRALNNVASGIGSRSRVPSYCETPSAQTTGMGMSELPTVFDEGEGDLSCTSASLGLELELLPGEGEGMKGGDERERSRSRVTSRDAVLGTEHLPDPSHEQDHFQEVDQDHEPDDENEAELATNPTLSRSTSMVRRRKRGARRGKGAIIQQQQMEIARLQMQQEQLTRQVMMMQEQLTLTQQQQTQGQLQVQAPVQHAQGKGRGKSSERPILGLQTQAQVQVLTSLNPTPTSTTAPRSFSQSSPLVSQIPQMPMTGGDVLDSLASASEALARELSRAKNARSPSAQQGQLTQQGHSVSSPLLVPMRAISGGGTRENSPARSSISGSHLTSNSRSGSIRAASLSSTGLTTQASPSAAMALSGAGGPTPGAMFPVSFAPSSLSLSSRSSQGKSRARDSTPSNSGVSAKNEPVNAHTGAAAGASGGPGALASGAGSGTSNANGSAPASVPTQTPAPAPAIAKKTSKWKLSFGKGSSSSSHNRAPLPLPMTVPVTAPVQERKADIVLDISKESSEVNANGSVEKAGSVIALSTSLQQSTNVNVDANANSSEESAAQLGASSTASRVKSVLMSLDAGLNSTTTGAMNNFKGTVQPNANAAGSGAGVEPWSRGRRPAGNQHQSSHPWNVSSSPSNESRWPAVERERNVSPNSTRTGRSGSNLSPPSNAASGVPPSASASSLSNASSNKNNWRTSTYSTLTTSSATSGWTRYSGSNASMRSVSTVATSVSGASGTGSWRNGRSDASLASSVGAGGEGGRKPTHYVPGQGGPGSIASRKSDKSSMSGMPPPNVKIMTGVPWALDELPRQLHPNPSGDIFGMPPAQRKQRVRKPKDLPTINERPSQAHHLNSSSSMPFNHNGSRIPPNKSPLSQRVDAARSSTSLHRSSGEGIGINEFGEASRTEGRDSEEREREGAAPRKVQKGQINALAKMLSALRR